MEEINENKNINPKLEKNNKNTKILIKEEIIQLSEDEEKSSEISQPYVKKIVGKKTVDDKFDKSKDKNRKLVKKLDTNNKNEKDSNNKTEIKNGYENNEQNLSVSSNNDNNGNYSQVLFDYKNFNGEKGKRKRDDEELAELKNKIDFLAKQKKKGWIQKGEEGNELKKPKEKENKKDILLQSYINENIKEKKEKEESENISLLSLSKINEEEYEEKKEQKNDIDELKDKNMIKQAEKKLNNSNSEDDLLLLDKMVDNDSFINNSIKKINNIQQINKSNNNSNKKNSQEGLDLDFNSNVQSKEKNYNFNNNLILENDKEENEKYKEKEKNSNLSKYQEYLKYKKLNENKKEEKKELSKKNNYELEIKTQEDQQTYDEFYKMSHNNKKNNLIIPENSRLKKEREKMVGHKCELCQKFYDCINEDNFLCQECSRHRTNAPVNKTPQGFYDLSL